MTARRRIVQGFTLIELMLVVTLLGLLAAIALPNFWRLISEAQAATTKGNLGAMRSALSIYYSENEGQFPRDNLTSLTVGGRYLGAIPPAVFPAVDGFSPGHPSQTVVFIQGTPLSLIDTGGWGYENGPDGDVNVLTGEMTPWGTVMPNCVHSEPKGELWYLQ